MKKDNSISSGKDNNSNLRELIMDDFIKMLTDILDVTPDKISPEDNLVEDLNLDSLQMYELVVDMEEVYSIRLTDDCLDSVKIVNEAVDLIYSLAGKGKN